MRIAIIGAGAGIGLATVMQALQKGHTVVALSTNVTAIPDHPHLITIKGSATVTADLKKVMEGADAVLITVGTKNKKATHLFSDIAKAVVQLTNELDFSAPVITITGFGAGQSKSYLSFFMKTVIRLFLKDQYINKTLMEEIFASSKVNWEIVRPGMLTNNALTTSYKALPELKKGMKVGKISREDVAHFLIEETEKQQYLGKYVALSY
ncbi:NAD(P)-dependent oxidoreductase [Chitinophaga pinensis]|uniref:NAD-dependent epimerase/dehydratase n=1 Tax=Chitinophaga pinensis (strain ATCC 43595 / DSM 2588 / LMG 13176 / NBRC 15968 / NCIMB 11800 / UQM 2034) TaxID=485918 RepID=A0A979GS76_CHIPD|nr:NAD(P)H-binding protein [Chitinophaga pinensis]ACU61233.1 NAD-dependent epimerase/dehydratase [Chitinophaga pinensis DSM 2588]